jgi:hypothetical protein
LDGEKKENTTAQYTICLKNHLDSRWEHWFAGMAITYTEDGLTTLTGRVADQSALHGIFEKIRSLNLTLISCQRDDPQLRKEGNSENEKS